MKVKEFRELVVKHFESMIDFYFNWIYIFSLENISEGQEYDPKDIQRFNEVDEYTLMFIQHGQFGTSFDQERALRVFNGSMTWRKQNNVYGKTKSSIMCNKSLFL